MKLKIAGIVVLIITLLSFPAYAGTWQKNKDKIRYKRDDGSYVISDWVEDVDGRWYYFDSDGLMVTKSWVQGKYYVDYEGVMLANTITPDGYRVNSHGEMPYWTRQLQQSIGTIDKGRNLEREKC